MGNGPFRGGKVAPSVPISLPLTPILFLLCLLLLPQLLLALPGGRKAPGPREEPQGPAVQNVQCTSTKGSFTIEMHPEWAPIGAERFLALVRDSAYDGTVIYRVVRRGKERAPEAVQFGFIRDEALRQKWRDLPNLQDDRQIFKNPNFHRGMISFAGGGPNTRSTDVFITFMTGNANGTPRAPWETPFGIIDEEGLRVIGAFGGTGDLKMLGGNAPDLGKGYEALKESHPDIDYLGKCTLVLANPTPVTTLSPTHTAASDQQDDGTLGGRTRKLPLLPSLLANDMMSGDTTTSLVILLGLTTIATVCAASVRFRGWFRFRKMHGV